MIPIYKFTSGIVGPVYQSSHSSTEAEFCVCWNFIKCAALRICSGLW